MTRLKWLVALAPLLCNCAEDTLAPPPTVVAQKWLAAGDCWASFEQSHPLDPALNIGACAETVDARLAGAEDRLRLVIDYGKDVRFGRGTEIPAPEVFMTLDGAAVPSGASVVSQPREDERGLFFATLEAPARAVGEMRLLVRAATGFESIVTPVLAVDAPRLEVLVAQCPQSASCELVGGVGTAAVRVLVPGKTPKTVILRSRIDGVPQAAADSTSSTPVGERTEARFFPEVPPARDGAIWSLEAQVDGVTAASGNIRLRAPIINAALNCAAPCSVEPGASVGLSVTAPRGMNVKQAIVTTTTNGVPATATIPVNLTAEDILADTRSGAIPLPAPQVPGAIWQIDVSVAGYRAQALLVTTEASP